MKLVHVIPTALLGAFCSHASAQLDDPNTVPPTQAAITEPLQNPPSQQQAVLMPPQAVQQVQVRVLSTMPVQVTTAQGVELSYKTVYELSGQQYVVQLPQDPGDYLTLQLPMPTVPMAASASGSLVQVQTVVAVPYAVYPSVFFVGSLYRPLPYIGSIHHHPAGGGRFGRRGGRH
jgi:hypothetical protein